MTDSRRKLLLETIPEIRTLASERFSNLLREAERCGWRVDDLQDPTLRAALRDAGLGRLLVTDLVNEPE